jgi:CelD/BcsL family acetyltransferase involved in cellulose biosynthesis
LLETAVIRDSVGFEQLEPHWNHLLERGTAGGCHSTFEWLSTWWRHFGVGRQLLLAVASEDSVVVGIAPMYVDTQRRSLHFIGQGLSDYADVLVPEGRTDIVRALIESVLGERSSWDAVGLEELPQASPNLAVIAACFAEAGVALSEHVTVKCPYLPITATWEEFWPSLGKSFRHDRHNKMNRCRRDGLELDYNDRRTVDSALLDEVVALSDRRRSFDTHRSPFLCHPDQEFLRDVLPLMGSRNQLRFGELRVEGRLAAFVLAYHWRGTVYDWNTQYDPDYYAYSLGRIVLATVVKQTFREGCHEFDFMRGEEDYKFQWTSLSRTNTALRTASGL